MHLEMNKRRSMGQVVRQQERPYKRRAVGRAVEHAAVAMCGRYKSAWGSHITLTVLGAGTDAVNTLQAA